MFIWYIILDDGPNIMTPVGYTEDNRSRGGGDELLVIWRVWVGHSTGGKREKVTLKNLLRSTNDNKLLARHDLRLLKYLVQESKWTYSTGKIIFNNFTILMKFLIFKPHIIFDGIKRVTTKKQKKNFAKFFIPPYSFFLETYILESVLDNCVGRYY